MEKNIFKKHFDNPNQATVKLLGKEMKLSYFGDRVHFDNLITEIFDKEVYQDGIDKKNDVILDIGGYIGLSTMYFAQFAKKVYVLEPSHSYELMVENIKEAGLEDKVVSFKLALGNTDGERLIYRIGQDNIGVTMVPFSCDKDSYTVQMTRLDTFMNENKIEHVDLLQMDVEGMEYEILESEGFATVADRIDRVILEAHPFTVPGACSGDPWKIPYLLDRVGFKTELSRLADTWRVLLNYVDGSKRWALMPVFVAKR